MFHSDLEKKVFLPIGKKLSQMNSESQQTRATAAFQGNLADIRLNRFDCSGPATVLPFSER